MDVILPNPLFIFTCFLQIGWKGVEKWSSWNDVRIVLR